MRSMMTNDNEGPGTSTPCHSDNVPNSDVAGSVGYTVRVLPNNPMLASAAELGLVTLA